MTRQLLNVLKLTEYYKTDGINYAWLGRKTTTQQEKDVITIRVPYPDIDFCMMTKTYISYDTDEKQLYISNNLKLGKNHWLSTFIDDVKNNRVQIQDFYHGNYTQK